jgi:DNA-binding NarL/FixJ family response regulator
MAVRLLIADDHHIVTDGLQLLLDKKTNDVEIIAVAENGKEVLDILDKEKVDVFLIDIEMPEMNGIELAEKLMEINPESRIIMFSTHSNRKMIENALELGVKGYLLKEDTSRNLVNAIREVSEGNTFYSQKIANFVFNSYLNAKRGPKKNKK